MPLLSGREWSSKDGYPWQNLVWCPLHHRVALCIWHPLWNVLSPSTEISTCPRMHPGNKKCKRVQHGLNCLIWTSDSTSRLLTGSLHLFQNIANMNMAHVGAPKYPPIEDVKRNISPPSALVRTGIQEIENVVRINTNNLKNIPFIISKLDLYENVKQWEPEKKKI